jgi:hypothetical protein
MGNQKRHSGKKRIYGSRRSAAARAMFHLAVAFYRLGLALAVLSLLAAASVVVAIPVRHGARARARRHPRDRPLDLRIDYQKPAIAGLDVRAHSVCTRVARSIAFVHSTAYQVPEDDPIATPWPARSRRAHVRGSSLTRVVFHFPSNERIACGTDVSGPVSCG